MNGIDDENVQASSNQPQAAEPLTLSTPVKVLTLLTNITPREVLYAPHNLAKVKSSLLAYLALLYRQLMIIIYRCNGYKVQLVLVAMGPLTSYHLTSFAPF